LFPPATVPDGDQSEGASDPSNFAIRIARLEDELRRAYGMIEELQNDNQRLEAELKRFREDVEFRLGGPKAPVAAAPTPAPTVAAAQPTPEEPKPRKGDAFDPNADPDAVGAPHPLGSTAPSAPLSNGLEFKPGARPPSEPMDIGPRATTAPTPVAAATPTTLPKPAESGPMVIGSGIDFSDAPRQQFTAAMEAYKGGQYDLAATQLKAFLTENSGHRLVPDAVFFLGETYLQRSRPREAAEQYLKLSTDYAKSPRAPEGMMRLGQSLALLGNNEQACATFAEVGKRYPTASTTVRKTVEREMQKDHC
jgi:tol-pal system protein YbgF